MFPVTGSYPGVYIEEVPSGVHPITQVATSITAFIGRALRGPVNEPTPIHSFLEFEHCSGGLWPESTMSYAVQHFFANGGTHAIVVRIVHTAEDDSADKATKAKATVGSLGLEAADEGSWGNRLKAIVSHETSDPADNTLFDLRIQELATKNPNEVVASEEFLSVSTDPTSPRYVEGVLAERSLLVRVPNASNVPEVRPPEVEVALTSGNDGGVLEADDYEGNGAKRTGIGALDKADLFNLLCIPPFTRDAPVELSTWLVALAYCKDRRAILIVDPDPGWRSPEAVVAASQSTVGLFNLRDENSILYYPRVKVADPLRENRLTEFPPCGVVAGVFARTDATRGVWKAPAGRDAALLGVRGLAYEMNNAENDGINTIGVNALRAFPRIGNVVWGARTLKGSDQLANEYKYIPVRRLALFIEESLFRGLKWVVFEPNDESLWAQIRLSVEAFMHHLFRQGAFQGTAPRHSYFVKCDNETTTQNDLDLGIANILVGFAPLKPAEFVMIKLPLVAGQVDV